MYCILGIFSSLSPPLVGIASRTASLAQLQIKLTKGALRFYPYP